MKKTAGKVFLTILLLFTCMISVLAQDGGSTTKTTRVEQSVNVEPWVWVVGAAVFILILAVIVRGGKGRDVTITKTTTNSDI